jgi:DNA-3-methyladenine glycosylase II
VLKRLAQAVGPCTLQINADHFAVLVHSIVSQQISTRAAAAIRARLHESLAPRGLTASRILMRTEGQLRAVGLSVAKARALHDLADKVSRRVVPLKKLHQLPDEDVIACLVQVRGIGRWTAQMFLIFSLGRLDVLPVDDWGLRAGVRRHYGLAEAPRRAQLEAIAEPWRPYRSIATWYVWRSLGAVPQSATTAKD